MPHDGLRVMPIRRAVLDSLAIAHNDPVLIEHGIDEWSRRLNETLREAKLPNPEKVAAWTQAIGGKLERDWGREALQRSNWE